MRIWGPSVSEKLNKKENIMSEEKEKSAVVNDELKEYKVVEGSDDNGKKSKSKLKKFFKVLAWIFGISVALLILLVIFRDLLIENGVRHIGTFVTGTEVKIASFKSSFNGSVELKNIQVANPAGYKKPYAFEIGRIYVKLDTSTLLSDEPVVETVEVSGVAVDMEVKSASRSNISEIQAHVEKIAGVEESPDDKKGEEKKNEEEETPDPDAPAPLIKKITLTSMGVSVSSSTFNTSVPIPLAPLHLENIGGKGKPLGKTLLTVFQKLIGSINAVCGTFLTGVETIGSAGKTLGKGIADGTKSLSNAGKNIGSNISDSAKSVADGISGIFKKKK